jgi:hypothetical protein
LTAARIASAYDVKSTYGQATNEEQLRAKLQIAKDAYDDVKSGGNVVGVDLLLCPNFNRHHALCGGTQVLGEPDCTDDGMDRKFLQWAESLSSGR